MISRDMLGQLRHLLRPLANRIANSIARAVVQVVDDDTKLQLLQIGVLAGETVDEAERFQEFGFTSVPVAGAEAVVLFPNGDRAHPLVIAVDDRRHRPTGELQPGEAASYSSGGALVVYRLDGTVHVGSYDAADAAALASQVTALRDATATALDGIVTGAGTPVKSVDTSGSEKLRVD